MNDFGLATLLGEKSQFLQGDAPLEEAIVAHGDVKRLAPFTQLPELRSALSVMDAWDGRAKTGRAWSPAGSAKPFELYTTRDQIKTLYEAGFTIVLEDVESFIPALRPLCRQLERDLGVPPGKINVEVFCALKGGRGRPHFDPSFTFNCQVQGNKTWQLAKNPSLRFPPRGIGMFLGRSPSLELEPLLRESLPKDLEGLAVDTFVATPGSVVFLPPGVIHATSMDTESFAIAFAIEETDCIADMMGSRVRDRLLRVDSLRAPRLGFQTRDLRDEAVSVAAQLRELADELEQGQSPWLDGVTNVRIRAGLSAKKESETSIALRTENTTRTLTLDPEMVSILDWASKRDAFSVSDVVCDLSAIDPEVADGCLKRLVYVGLLESASE